MPEKSTVAVTGVTGALGSRIAAQLSERGVPQLLVGRDPARITELPGAQVRGPATYDDSEAMREALRDASTLVLISSHPTGRRLEEHASAVRAGIEAGVRRVLYVSLVGSTGPDAPYRNARDHWMTERYLAGCGLRHTIFRAGLYGSTIAALADSELAVRGPGGDGKVAWVTHDDIAEVIATVAADEDGAEHDGEVLQITGPESLTIDAATKQIAAATGRNYHYVPQTLDEAFAWRWKHGISGEQIDSWLSWYQTVASGRLDFTTDVVKRITGRPAKPISEAGWWPSPKTAW